MDVARDNILRRVRAALGLAAHRPPPPTSAPVFPPVVDADARFRTEFATLRGEIIEDAGALHTFLNGFTKIATDGGELTTKCVCEPNAGVRECDLGVTGCDGLVAQAGSIIVATLSAGGRALSVLPPTHLVVARREQIVPDLVVAMALLRKRYDRHWPSALSVITGPRSEEH